MAQAKFPAFGANDLNEIPVSTDNSGQYKDLINTGLFDPNNFFQQGDAFVLDSSGVLIPKQPITDAIQIDSLIGPCILSGMELTENADNTKFDIAAGKYTVHESGTSAKAVIVDFAGMTDVDAANPLNTNVVFVYIDKNQAITFKPSRDREQTICLIGELRMDKGTTVIDVFNVADRASNHFLQFAEYMNGFGVWHQGVHIKRNATADSFATDGGSLYTYSTSGSGGTPLQAAPKIPFITIDDLGQESTPIDTFNDVGFFKEYTLVGGGATNTIAQVTEFVIWLVYVNLGGQFFLLKPQAKIDIPPSGLLGQGQILNYINGTIQPFDITDESTPIAAIVANGTMTSIADLNIFQIRNRLSNGVGLTDESQVIPLSTPLSPNELQGETKLATDGTAYIKQKSLPDPVGLASLPTAPTVLMNLGTKQPVLPVTYQEPQPLGAYWIISPPISNVILLPAENTLIATNITGLSFQGNQREARGTFGDAQIEQDCHIAFAEAQAEEFFTAVSNALPNSTDLLETNSSYWIILVNSFATSYTLSDSYLGTKYLPSVAQGYIDNKDYYDKLALGSFDAPYQFATPYHFIYSPEKSTTNDRRFYTKTSLAAGVSPESAIKSIQGNSYSIKDLSEGRVSSAVLNNLVFFSNISGRDSTVLPRGRGSYASYPGDDRASSPHGPHRALLFIPK